MDRKMREESDIIPLQILRIFLSMAWSGNIREAGVRWIFRQRYWEGKSESIIRGKLRADASIMFDRRVRTQRKKRWGIPQTLIVVRRWRVWIIHWIPYRLRWWWRLSGRWCIRWRRWLYRSDSVRGCYWVKRRAVG